MAIWGAQGTLGSASVARASRSKTLIQRIWAARWCYLFMLPALILTTMFTLYPSVASWYYSLLDWSGFTNERTFVGLSNYAQVIHDQFFWNAFGHSFLLPLVLTLTRPDLRTLAVGIYAFKGQYFVDWSGMAAAATIGLLPIIAVFLFLQRYFVEGIAGAVKQ